MSALPSKADMFSVEIDVCFRHKQTLEQASEMSALPTKADMRLAVQKCPLSAKADMKARLPLARVA